MSRRSSVAKRFALTVLLWGSSAFCGCPVVADTLATYQLSNVTLSDGGTASGTFTYDFTTGQPASVDVTAEGGIFNNSNSYPTSVTPSSFDGNYDTQQVSYNFAYVLDTPLSATSGAKITLDPTQSYLTVDTSGNGGGVTTIPITGGNIALVKTVYSPTITAVTPSAITVGSADTRLTMAGQHFDRSCIVYWNGSANATTYGSSIQITAVVPAALLMSAGAMQVTVSGSAGTSSAYVVTVGVPRVSLGPMTLTRNADRSVTVSGSIKNAAAFTAPGLSLTTAKLGKAATTTALPLSLGSLGKNQSANFALTFAPGAGATGATVTLSVSGAYLGQSWEASKTVTLP